MTRWVSAIVVACVAVFVLQSQVPGLTEQLVWYPPDALARPWTAVTAMFAHGGFGHILFNMIALYSFGPRVEARLGGARFLGLYFVSGLMGALFCFIQPQHPVLGASGAIFGVALAYARYWPRDLVLVFFIPMTTRVMVIVFTLLSVGGAISPVPLPFMGNVAHLGHLGGFVGGWLFLLWMERATGGRHFRQRAEMGWTAERKAAAPLPKAVVELAMGEKETLERWGRIRVDQLHPVNREEYDRIGAKIAAGGLRSLTPLEREFMERFAALAG
ncbi:MAG TPA: rhomboid family intramembrane serine protease [Gemmatimonadales bacterium]|nr:rhomboid family intramembrane serine protease [Gemmatimonadales bacterium]